MVQCEGYRHSEGFKESSSSCAGCTCASLLIAPPAASFLLCPSDTFQELRHPSTLLLAINFRVTARGTEETRRHILEKSLR